MVCMGPTSGGASRERGDAEPPPSEHPYPPEGFDEIELPVQEVYGPLWRLFPAIYDEPLYFGSGGGNRFDAPDHGYGTLCTAEETLGAFIETFGRRLGYNLLTGAELSRKHLARIHAERPLRLANLVGKGQSAAGVDASLFSGPYAVSQSYSLAIHQHPFRLDGIRFPARHDTEQVSVALYERARPSLEAEVLGALNESRNTDELARILSHYDHFGYRE